MRLLLALLMTTNAAVADLPVVERVVATPGAGGWTIAVTVRHADADWEHYADGWSVFDADGVELAHRPLAHPHVDEQPFTRSLSGVVLPEGVLRLVVRAHDGIHGWGPRFELSLP